MARDFRFGISSSIQGVDLNQLLVDHPASTYFMRVAEDNLPLLLRAGDVLVVDRSLEVKPNDILVVAEEDSSELKIVHSNQLNGSYEVWGVVTFNIAKQRASS